MNTERFAMARLCICISTVLLTIGGGQASGRELESTGWRMTGENEGDLAKMLDRKIDTCWTSRVAQKEGVGFTIDFGRPLMVHRIQLKTGERRLHYPRSLRLAAGENREQLTPFVECENARTPLLDLNLRFNPVACRYLRVETGREGTAFPWTVAEMHVFGFSGAESLKVRDAVIVSADAPGPLRQAARDVAYYVGEITGRPVAVVSPAEAADYPGTRFVVDKAKPVQYAPADFIRRDREATHVYKVGREIHFGGQTPEAVMYSMFEFLDSQGIRWLFPSDDGDFVSRRGELDLSVLPLVYRPQFVVRFFQGSTNLGRPSSEAQRWLDHTHWNRFFGSRGHAYRGNGHHSFGRLIPDTLYKEHPDWFPMMVDEKWRPALEKKGYQLRQRIPCRTLGWTTFCTSSTGAREHIVQQAVAKAKKKPDFHSLMLGEMDATQWCECPRCRAQDQGAPMVMTGWGLLQSKSERLFDLAAYIARRLREEMPDRPIQVATMAYSQSKLAPVSIARLPANMSVDVVDHPFFYLPVSSPCNRVFLRTLDDWSARTAHLGIYTHHLLGTSAKTPIVGITTLAEWFRLWARRGVDTFMPEVNSRMENWRCNPWFYYAYARLMWNPQEKAGQILDDFFRGYFRESWEPMLTYYRTLEDHVRKDDLRYAGGSGARFLVTRDIFTDRVLKILASALQQARGKASDYRTRQRVEDVAIGFRTVPDSLDVKIAGW